MSATATPEPATIDVPAELVAAIDELVGQERRAEFVRGALAEWVGRRRRLDALAALGRLSRPGPPAWEAGESASERVRALRREWEAPVPDSGPE